MESVNESILTSEATLEEWLSRWLILVCSVLGFPTPRQHHRNHQENLFHAKNPIYPAPVAQLLWMEFLLFLV